LWAEHGSPKMAANTPILKLLATKAQQVFVPTTWEGIIGLGDLDFDFDVNMPARMKPKARHINPKMCGRTLRRSSHGCEAISMRRLGYLGPRA
jgi:hypothetical protein